MLYAFSHPSSTLDIGRNQADSHLDDVAGKSQRSLAIGVSSGDGRIYAVLEVSPAPLAAARPATVARRKTFDLWPELASDGWMCPAEAGSSSLAPSFAELSEHPADALVPYLDRQGVEEASLNPHRRAWRRDGVVLLPRFMPAPLTHAYCRVREKVAAPGGYDSPVPYMVVPEIRAICCYPPLQRLLQTLIGGPMGLHLNLTGWVSTERTWHQDDYLNPPFVNSWYAAIWVALDDIHPDSGPFQYVPGSHRWPVVRRDRVLARLTAAERQSPTWPKAAERFVTAAYADQIARTGLPIRSFLGRRGDVLVWHGRLVHQGAAPRVPGMLRRGLIAHYTEVSHRPDLPHVGWTRHQVPIFLFKH